MPAGETPDHSTDDVRSESEWAPQAQASEWEAPGSFTSPASAPSPVEPTDSNSESPAETGFPTENNASQAAESDSPEIFDAAEPTSEPEIAQDDAQGHDSWAPDGQNRPADDENHTPDGSSADDSSGAVAEASEPDHAGDDSTPSEIAYGDDAATAESGDGDDLQANGEVVVTGDDSSSDDSSSDDLRETDPAADDSGEDAVTDSETDPETDDETVAPETVAPEADPADESSPEPEAAAEEPVVVAPAKVNPITAATLDDTPLARELAEITRRRQALNAQSLPLPDAPRIFTVANQKGGVGKTTTTVNLAAALARGGARVLVIDLDPQGNASTALGVEHRADTVSVYDVIINDEPMAEVVQKSPEFAGLFCVPATIHLAGAEIELVSLVAREQRLRTALDLFLSEAEDPFHYVFIDCPPSLGLLTINAFVAAREVLIPIQCEYYALEGLSQLLSNIQLIERHLNPRLTVSTILLTMYDGRTNLANQVADDVREHFPREVLDTLIPRSVRISEAPSYGQSVISYDPSSPGSLSYLEAAAEIAKRGAPA